MQSKLWKALLALAASAIFILAVQRSAAARDEDWEAASRRLEGTWIVTVTQHDCTSGAQLGQPFQSYLTFARGGTMTETTSNPMFFPALRGPGHGIWSYEGHHNYSAKSTAFITLNGALTSTQTIAQTIAIGDDPNQFTTTSASVQFFDPAGNPIRSGCAAASGQRFQ